LEVIRDEVESAVRDLKRSVRFRDRRVADLWGGRSLEVLEKQVNWYLLPDAVFKTLCVVVMLWCLFTWNKL
jgi:hypothetical protein